jgi:hypothetical protein
MKLNFIVSFYFFLFLQLPSTLAQNRALDSLEVVLKQTDDDSLKLKILSNLATKTIRKNPPKSIVYILEGIRLAEKHQNHDRLYVFYYIYSQYLSSTSTIDSAIFVLEKAASYLTQNSEAKRRSAVLTLHANLLKNKGDFAEATKKYIEALNIAKKEQLPEALVSSYIGLSTLFYSQKMYVEAIEYNQKCAGICDELKPHRVPFCFGVVYSNLSNFYLKQQQVDSAIYYGLKSIQVKEQVNNIRGLSFSYNTVASAYLKKKDTLTAIQFFEKALITTKKVKDFNSLSQTLAHIGKIHVVRKDLPQLNKIIIELDSIIYKIQNPLHLINYFQIKRNYFELKKDYKSALEFVKKQSAMVDSTRKKSNATLIASLETKYRTDQHQLEKELAQKELLLSDEKAVQSKRNLIGVSIFALSIILLLLYILSRLNIIKQQKTALNKAYDQLEQQKQNEVALLSLKALQAQMNPHFLFNALNSIQDLVLLKDIKNSTIYLGKFSALIRKILLSSKEQFISLDQELEILRLYLDLEKLRFGDQLEIKFNADIPSEKQSDILLPAMFIQPYIENAIKHGLFHKEGLKKLLVDFKLSDNFLTCIIEDNGIGQEKANEMKIKTLHLHTGFSTEAIHDRVKYLNQSLNKKIIIKTEDLMEQKAPTGTRVTLRFPLS